jgi:hypothetical protein
MVHVLGLNENAFRFTGRNSKFRFRGYCRVIILIFLQKYGKIFVNFFVRKPIYVSILARPTFVYITPNRRFDIRIAVIFKSHLSS